MILSKAHSITGYSTERAKGDFYPTPPHVTEALLNVEGFSGNILEPACGQGHISKVLEAHGYEVKSSDLFEYGYGECGNDFLFFPQANSFDNVITNPPYSRAKEFVEVALNVSRHKVAMLLKLSFLEGVTRQQFFKETPFKKIYVFSRRISLTRLGEPMINKGMITFAWFIWDKRHKGEPTIDWI
jgi:adenine-specific DNA methylase